MFKKLNHFYLIHSMIYILSHLTSEYSTELILDWIHYLGENGERINGIDLLKHKNAFKIEITENSGIEITGFINNETTDIAWFRRWGFDRNTAIEFMTNSIYKEGDLLELAKSEFNSLSVSFCAAFDKVKWAENPALLKKDPNKIQQLQRAKSLGLDIPTTIITNNKNDLIKFIDSLSHKPVIIKPIKDFFILNIDDNSANATYTKIINDSVEELEEVFFPSLFQEAIYKEFEARIFYLDGTCYSMGIFSSNDEQTNEDFRKYNFKKPNRCVPINLPESIGYKIKLFMESYEMKSGSLDFIVDNEYRFVFLEVNPLGQFGMVSTPCNYFLEREIASWLIKLGDKNNKK